MDQNATYASPADAAHAVRQAISGLVGQPPAALVLTGADLYPLEPMAANTPQWYQELAGAGVVADAVTYSTLAGSFGQLVHLGLFEHVFFGRCLSATRDPPAVPARRAFAQLAPLCQSTGLLRAVNAVPITPSCLKQWLDLSQDPTEMVIMADHGTGIGAGEQRWGRAANN